jgi:lysozyme family protein
MKRQIEFVLAREGGYVHDPADKGGETNMGITRPTWREFCAANPDYPKLSIRNLGRDDAICFYRWWWNSRELGLSLIKCPGVQMCIFDTSVLFGRARAARWTQEVCNHLVGGLPLVVDGVVGPKSAAVVNRLLSRDFILAFDTRRRDYHMMRATQDASQKRFVTGWLNRCDHVRQAAIEMAIEAGNA